MASSRYRNAESVSGSYYGTYEFPNDSLATVPTWSYRTTSVDRLDTLAFKYLGSGEYWWVLAMINDIDWAFNFTPGEIIKIPNDVQDVLRFI